MNNQVLKGILWRKTEKMHMFLKKEIIRRNTLYPEKLQDIHRIFWGLQIGFETRSDRAIIPLA